jgi:hypothetical protein
MLSRSIDDFRQSQTPGAFRDAMRRIASSVMIITSRDVDGQPHGMAASAVIPVSMDPPSMLVAINRDAGLYPVVQRTRRFCVNLLGDDQQHLLAPFSQSALRAQRYAVPVPVEGRLPAHMKSFDPALQQDEARMRCERIFGAAEYAPSEPDQPASTNVVHGEVGRDAERGQILRRQRHEHAGGGSDVDAVDPLAPKASPEVGFALGSAVMISRRRHDLSQDSPWTT